MKYTLAKLYRLTVYIGLTLACGSMTSVSAKASLNTQNKGAIYEKSVTAIVDKISSGELVEALEMSNQLTSKYENSRIGHLLKADILTAINGDLDNFGEGIKSQRLNNKNFKHELNNRLSSNSFIEQDKLPASVVDMGDEPLVLIAEMQTGRFFLFENNAGRPKLIGDYYMTIGKAGYGKQYEGDNKTPLGVYRVTHEIAGTQLPDLYGSGAFPVNYPNIIDKWRRRTGYGIWLHGTPSETYSRAPLASEGCFVLSNDDYDAIAPHIRHAKNPPVVLKDKIDWLSLQEHEKRRQTFLALINDWAQDWESLNVERYLGNYDSADFQFGKKDFSEWSNRKHRIGKSKTFIQLGINVRGLYLYPGEKNMFMVDFKQSYLSNNHKSVTNKKQYWRRDKAGDWKIVYEG